MAVMINMILSEPLEEALLYMFKEYLGSTLDNSKFGKISTETKIRRRLMTRAEKINPAKYFPFEASLGILATLKTISIGIINNTGLD